MRTAFFTALAAAALLAVAGTGQARSASNCNPAHSKTIKRNSTARVFSLKGRYYACKFSRNFAFHLADDNRPEDATYHHITLSRGFVAYAADVICDACNPQQIVFSHDLRTGRAVVENEAVAEHGTSDRESEVLSLVLGDRGSLAWVADTDGPKREVLTPKNIDRPKQLDEGAGIAPASLRLSGRKLSWANGGTPKSATLR